MLDNNVRNRITISTIGTRYINTVKIREKNKTEQNTFAHTPHKATTLRARGALVCGDIQYYTIIQLHVNRTYSEVFK